ncbi:MAG TPA: HYR domain-containing protein [Gemmatimonadaceae bacterium]
MPAGVHSYDMPVSDSAKGFWLSAGSGTLLSAPVDVSANVLVPSGAARSSSVGAFKYAVSRVPFEVEAIPGVIIPQDSVTDDGYLTDIPLGFNFDFYGATYDKVNVYSNGFLEFGAPQIDPARAGFFKGGFIPGAQLPNNIIAFAWTDWSPQLVYGGIRYETRGTAPHRRFLLQFNNVPAFHSPTGTVMMQLVLNEGSNVITIYTNTLVITNSSQRITQGIENANGTAAAFDSVTNTLVGVTSPRVANFFSLTNDAVRFTPPQPPVLTIPKDTTVLTAPPATSANRQAFSITPALGSCVADFSPGVATATDDGSVVSLVGVRSDDPTLALDAPYPKGVTRITWTATDNDNMTTSATETITVVDKENPWLAAPASVSADNDPHLPSAVVSVGSAQAADNCTDVKVSSARSDGAALTAPFMVGETTVTWTATDASGNTTSASQSVKVRDVEAPSLTVPAGVTLPATSPSGAAVTYQLSATDNVAVTSVTCTRASGATFPVGTTSVTCTAADAAGNSTSGSFDVYVYDAPTQMNNLIRYVLSLGMPSGTTNPLVNQLYAAFGSSTSDNHVACVKMSDFISMVGKKGRDIQPIPSGYMTSQATQIMVVLACPAARLNAPVGTVGAGN